MSFVILLHPSPTDSRNTGAYVARPRPGYHNIKETMRMRCASSFRGAFRPTTFFCFLCSLGVFVLSDMTGETSKNASSLDCVSCVVFFF